MRAEHKKEIVYLDSSVSAGMFAAYYMVLGALEYSHEHKLSGVKVNFRREGLYYDPAKGNNWWEYYFEPLPLHKKGKKCKLRKIAPIKKVAFITKGTRLSKGRAHQLIEQYIHVKPFIQQKADAFVEEHFKGLHIIGVHYRGTDKDSEAPRVSYETVYDKICEEIAAYGASNYRIFVATDEQAFLNFMLMRFGEDVIYRDAMRSLGKEPVHFARLDPYEAGEEALLDCLILSRSSVLIRTSSNLSSVSSKMNPNLRVINLSRSRVY